MTKQKPWVLLPCGWTYTDFNFTDAVKHIFNTDKDENNKKNRKTTTKKINEGTDERFSSDSIVDTSV